MTQIKVQQNAKGFSALMMDCKRIEGGKYEPERKAIVARAATPKELSELQVHWNSKRN